MSAPPLINIDPTSISDVDRRRFVKTLASLVARRAIAEVLGSGTIPTSASVTRNRAA